MKTIGILLCEELFLKTYHELRSEIKDINVNEHVMLLDTPSKEIYEKKNGIGHIYIHGPLSNNGPDMFDHMLGLGGTSYQEIINGINKAEDDGVKELFFHFDTPGGEVGIVDKVWNRVKSTKLKTTAIADGMIASAGYYIASATDKIVSSSPSFEIGSIGVIISTYGIKGYLEKDGIKEITLRSSNAYRKAPDIETEEGQQEYIERIDATERLFIKRVSTGRGVSENNVIKNFGNGAVFQSQDVDKEKPSALKIGLIDEVKQGFRQSFESKKKGLEMTVKKDDKSIEETVLVTKKEPVVNDNEFALGIIKNGAYPKAINSLAADVLAGTHEKNALVAAVAAIDASREEESSEIAKIEEKNIPTKEKNESEYNGFVKNAEDYEIAKRRMGGI